MVVTTLANQWPSINSRKDVQTDVQVTLQVIVMDVTATFTNEYIYTDK